MKQLKNWRSVCKTEFHMAKTLTSQLSNNCSSYCQCFGRYGIIEWFKPARSWIERKWPGIGAYWYGKMMCSKMESSGLVCTGFDGRKNDTSSAAGQRWALDWIWIGLHPDYNELFGVGLDPDYKSLLLQNLGSGQDLDRVNEKEMQHFLC